MPNPGAFQGSRKLFLLGEREAYAAGVAGGYTKDALALIWSRYFKRFPIDIPHDQEPSAEQLANVDDDAPEPELDPLEESEMSPEDFIHEWGRREERKKLFDFRKSIKRWLAYQYMKEHDIDPKESGAHNPYHALLYKLTGQAVSRPRRRTAVNIWRTAHKELIEMETRKEVIKISADRRQLASLREKVAKSLFQRLTPAEKASYEQQSTEEHTAALTKWQEDLEAPMSTTPADRQRCIQGLVRFMQPILDMVSGATGWKSTFISGGPEPAHGGRLNVISVHSGTTSGDIKMNFGRAERVRYKQDILPVFGNFLKKCYSPAECRSRALDAEEGFDTIDSDELERMGAGLYTMDEIMDGSQRACTSLPPSAASLCTTDPLFGTEQAQSVVHHTTNSTGTLDLSAPLPLPSETTHSPFVSPVPSPYASPAPSRFASPVPSHIPSPAPSRLPSPAPLLTESPRSSVNILGRDLESSLMAESETLCSSFDSSLASTAERSEADELDVPENASSNKSLIHRAAKGKNRDSNQANSPVTKRRRQALDTPEIIGSEDHVLGRTRGSRKRTHPGSINPDTKIVHAAATSSEYPPWVKNAISMFNKDSLGPSWAQLVTAWLAFEAKENYTHRGLLSTKHRPSCVGDWIGRHRSPIWRPILGDIKKYSTTYMTWWTSLQPKWRLTKQGKINVKVIHGEWNVLRKPGINGLFSVMAALFFWGVNVQDEQKAKKEWMAAVQDLVLVCTELQAAS